MLGKADRPAAQDRQKDREEVSRSSRTDYLKEKAHGIKARCLPRDDRFLPGGVPRYQSPGGSPKAQERGIHRQDHHRPVLPPEETRGTGPKPGGIHPLRIRPGKADSDRLGALRQPDLWESRQKALRFGRHRIVQPYALCRVYPLPETGGPPSGIAQRLPVL